VVQLAVFGLADVAVARLFEERRGSPLPDDAVAWTRRALSDPTAPAA